ncbi:MAG: hypothetical protein Kow0056_00720 [Coriobacteriia bacterium]
MTYGANTMNTAEDRPCAGEDASALCDVVSRGRSRRDTKRAAMRLMRAGYRNRDGRTYMGETLRDARVLTEDDRCMRVRPAPSV